MKGWSFDFFQRVACIVSLGIVVQLAVVYDRSYIKSLAHVHLL